MRRHRRTASFLITALILTGGIAPRQAISGDESFTKHVVVAQEGHAADVATIAPWWQCN